MVLERSGGVAVFFGFGVFRVPSCRVATTGPRTAAINISDSVHLVLSHEGFDGYTQCSAHDDLNPPTRQSIVPTGPPVPGRATRRRPPVTPRGPRSGRMTRTVTNRSTGGLSLGRCLASGAPRILIRGPSSRSGDSGSPAPTVVPESHKEFVGVDRPRVLVCRGGLTRRSVSP